LNIGIIPAQPAVGYSCPPADFFVRRVVDLDCRSR
jgi:hypothetical protein